MRRGLLLWALALAVLGMHHLALAPHPAGMACHQPVLAETQAGVLLDPPSAMSADEPAPGAGHDMLHVCLAVLNVAGWLLLLASLLMAVRRMSPPATNLRPRVVRAAGWPLRPAGRSLLASVCVLRI
jgi:hypothetical protein